MYSWTQSLPSEVKISEAYQMLKRQSIILDDPVYVNKAATTPVPQRTKSIFDSDEEKSKVVSVEGTGTSTNGCTCFRPCSVC